MINRYSVLAGMFLVLALVLWSAQIWNPAQAAPQGDREDPLFNIKFTNTRIDQVLSSFEPHLKLDLILDDSVKDKDLKLTITLENVSIRKATEAILKQMALKAKMKDDHALLIFDDTPENEKKYADLKPWP